MAEQAQQRKPVVTKTHVKVVVGIVLAVLALIIMFQNTDPVTTRLLFWQVQLPHVVLLLLMVAVGFVLGLMAMTMRRKRKAKER